MNFSSQHINKFFFFSVDSKNKSEKNQNKNSKKGDDTTILSDNCKT